MMNKAKTNEAPRVTRRGFLGSAAAAASIMIVPSHVLGRNGETPPSEKLSIAGIGVGGRGGDDINAVSSETLYALCDVDSRKAQGTFKKFEKAKRYTDFREMLDKEAKNIDAVVIGAPDHIHAPAAMMAVKLGKHVYCEKPLTHSIYEARTLTQAAKKAGVVTQMGNQGHGGEGLRQTYEWIHDGAIGNVLEVHGWSDRPAGWWPQGVDRPKDTPPVPDTLDWDLWLGPAPLRPYNPAYVPFKWRGWFDFGTGAMGDMAVHNMDPAWFCLDLGAPIATEAQSSEVHAETYPLWQIITYFFPPRNGSTKPFEVKWYDGGKKPAKPEGMPESEELGGNGILFIGEKGQILCGSHAGAPRLLPKKLDEEYKRPAKTLERSPGHHKEWILACKAGDPKMAKAGFDYSGPFVEALLVGNLATRLGKRIEWDAKNMKAKGLPEADPIIRRQYRKGWTL